MPSTDPDLHRAFKAFKKKLKMQQLEEDSRLGRGPMSGARTTVLSIQPPTGFGREIWVELAEKQWLKADGGGFYAIGASPPK